MAPEADIRRVAAEYGLDAEAEIARLKPFLSEYLELVFCADSFELISGGRGHAPSLANASGLGVAAEAFLETDRRFSGAMLGLKLAVGAQTPATLYHRSLMPLTCASELLAALGTGAGDPLTVFPDNTTLYGFGFTEFEDALRIKTYVLGAVGDRLGFRSLRFGPQGVERDVRVYTPEAGSDSIAALHARRALGVTRFGHVAHSALRTTKVYVERVGAIATDYSAI